MKSFIYILLLSCICNLLNAQNITPLEFENYDPLWSHYSFVPILDDSQQGFGVVLDKEYIYNEGDIFLIQNINNTDLNQGFLVESIDINTGSLNWQQYRYFDDAGNREITQFAYLDNNKLVLPLYKENQESSSLSFLSGFRGQIIFDTSTGIVIDSLVTDQRDSLNTSLVVPFNFFLPTLSSYIFPLSDTSVSYIKQEALLNSTLFDEFTLDNKGHIIDSHNIEIPVPYASRQVKVSRINEDSNLLFASSFSSDTSGIIQDSYCYIGVTTTDNIPIIQPQDFSNTLSSNLSIYNLEWTGPESCIIRVINKEFSEPNEDDISYVLLDYEGNILNHFTLSASESSMYSGGLKLGFIDENHIALCGLKFIDGCYNLNFYTNDASNNMRLTRSIKTQSEDQQLFLLKYSITPDKKSLIHLNHKNTTLPLAVIPNWSLLLLVDSQDVGILSNTVDKENLKLDIYPNPTTGLLSIDNVTPNSKVNIYNLDGKLVMHCLLKNNKIDISSLPSGPYIIEVEYYEVIRRFKIIKI